MLLTLAFVSCLYCRRRWAFAANERVAQMKEEYSDYATRERPGKKGKRRKSKPRAEYTPSESAL
jgi:hypothetical protein